MALTGVVGMTRIRQMYNMPPKEQHVGIPVETVTAGRGAVTRSMEYTGTVESYSVSSPAAKISERVEKVAVREGDRVNPGDVLITLSAAELQSKVDTLSRRVETAKLNLAHRESEVQVYKVLAEEGAIPEHDYNNIIYNRDTAAASLREAEALLAEAQLALNNTIIRSEIAGVVAAVDIEAGDQATPGKPLISVVDADNLKVLIQVIENDLPLIQPGMPAKIHFPGGRHIEASVGQTYPILDSKTRSATVEIPLPVKQVREQKVLSGMSANVVLVLAQKKDALLLPVDSVVQRQSKSYVFLVENGKAVQTEVKTGISDWNNVEIISGIDAKNQVVLRPPSDLRDGKDVYLLDGGSKS